MICVSCMNVWLLSGELEKRNVSLHAYIESLPNLMNLRIFEQTLTSLSNINDLSPACFIITDDFNARYL